MYISHNSVSSLRKNSFIITLILLFMILLVRLYYLQIVKGPRFRGIAEANRIRVVPIEAPRGIIYDRHGQIITDNKSQYNVEVVPYELRTTAEGDSIVAQIVGLTTAQVRHRIRNKWRGPFVPVKIVEDVDFQMLNRVEENKVNLPGVLYSLEPIRAFPTPAHLSQVLGYVREIGKNELKRVENLGYKQGDLIGWRGVEKQYEQVLRGSRGYTYLQIDALGREVGRLQDRDNVPPKPGNDLYLTIDLDLQVMAESLVGEHKGAIVILDAQNGEVLTLVSKPDYPPGLFAGVVSNEVWTSLRTDPDQPLYNRATQGTYPAGSTFKLIAIFTALEKKAVEPSWSAFCPGQYRLGRRIFKCWEAKGHGRMKMHDAIVHSCNVYFYNLIRRLDTDDWATYGKLFGFGQCTGIDLFPESEGVMPDVNFLNRKYGLNGWTDGNKLNLVIGQGDVLVTPVQMARFCASLATRGKLVQPHIGLKYIDKATNLTHEIVTKNDSIQTISPATWEFVENAMNEVVSSGTGRGALVRGVPVFGKTGTAQNPHGEAHAWFIGYMKEAHQTIALAVLIEHGKSGGGIAAQIAGKLFNYWHQRNANQMMATNATTSLPPVR